MDNSVVVKNIVKNLASTEDRVRSRAMRTLGALLQRPGAAGLSAATLAKLWRGLFFCMWHSDTPPVQEALATRIGALVGAFPATDAGLRFAGACFDELSRTWDALDALRVDKQALFTSFPSIHTHTNPHFRYMRLVRRVLEGCASAIASRGWAPADAAAFGTLLADGAFSPRAGPPFPPSLALHVLDLLLPTLDAAAASGADTTPGGPLFVERRIGGGGGSKEGADEPVAAAAAAVAEKSTKMPAEATEVAVLRPALAYLHEDPTTSVAKAIVARVLLPLAARHQYANIERNMAPVREQLAAWEVDVDNLPADVRMRLGKVARQVETLISGKPARCDKSAPTVPDLVRSLEQRLAEAYNRTHKRKRVVSKRQHHHIQQQRLAKKHKQQHS